MLDGGQGLSERREPAAVYMSASAFRYVAQADRTSELRDSILVLAQPYMR